MKRFNKHKMQAFCFFLHKRRTPTIEFDAGAQITKIPTDQPMPHSQEEVQARFLELINELGLEKEKMTEMLNLPIEKKWQIYCSRRKDILDWNPSELASVYVAKLNAFNMLSSNKSEEEYSNVIQLIKNLRTDLRTQPISFLLRLIDIGGVQSLLDFLKCVEKWEELNAAHVSAIGCIKALMNSSEGRSSIIKDPTALDILTEGLTSRDSRVKISILEMLGAVCLVPGGHKKVLKAMTYFQKYACELARFQTLMLDLSYNAAESRFDSGLATGIISFVNAAINYGPGQESLEFRVHLRYEFLMLGIVPIIEKLKIIGNATLERHLDFFEMIRLDDEWQIAKKFDLNHLNSKSASSMFEVLKKKLALTSAYPNFLSILFHLLQLTNNIKMQSEIWSLLDKVIQQIVLQTKEGDPDQAPLQINVSKLSKELADATAIKSLTKKLREVEKNKDELAQKLSKKENECSIKTQEQEEAIQMLAKMKAKLEQESQHAAQLDQKLAEATAQLDSLRHNLRSETEERRRLESAINMGSLPDDAKVRFSLGLNIDTFSSEIPSPLPNKNIHPPPLPPLPPPPPPPTLPPLLLNHKNSNSPTSKTSSSKKISTALSNIPEPTQPLKSFNWIKLPEFKVESTLWKSIDPSKIYGDLDLADFESKFSAYQRLENTAVDLDSSMMGTLSRAKTSKELSVIDGRRAQNCTILLSKLRMSNSELATAILNVDEHEDIQKDMCEQLLKFIPTPEEVSMLAEYSKDIDQMARADRFLYEMSRIDHYEPRLKAIYYKKRFNDRLSELKQRIEAVTEASKDLVNSRELRQLLEIVLALGNYMNRGQRGNAVGFKISSLMNIIDTKSSLNTKVTLLHYLAGLVEKKFPNICLLEEDIRRTKKASKINVQDLEIEIKELGSGLIDIEKEIDYFKMKSNCTEPRDRFVQIMTSFCVVANYNFSELNDQFKEMNLKFGAAVEMFGEDRSSTRTDEFFGIFDNFLQMFSEARLDNIRQQRIKEEELKRQKMEAQLRAEKENKERSRRLKSTDGENTGEFDELIVALRSGDVFGEESGRGRKLRRRNLSPYTNVQMPCRERTPPNSQ